MVVNLCLPWPPSANRYWRNVQGRTLISREAKKYKQDIRVISLLEKYPMMLSRLSVVIHAYPPDKRRRDIDNVIKVVLDALQDCGYYKDDSQIDEILIQRKNIRVPGGELYIELREL